MRHLIMIGGSFRQTTITLATVTGIAAIIFLWSIPAQDQSHTVNVVPIGFAEARGARDWTLQQRKTFLQDEVNQWSVDSAGETERGKLGPRRWLPAFGQCHYISRFVEVMERYGLSGDRDEMSRLRSQRQQCYTQFQ